MTDIPSGREAQKYRPQVRMTNQVVSPANYLVVRVNQVVPLVTCLVVQEDRVVDLVYQHQYAARTPVVRVAVTDNTHKRLTLK